MFFADCTDNFINGVEGQVLVHESGHAHALTFQSWRHCTRLQCQVHSHGWETIQEMHMPKLNIAQSISSPRPQAGCFAEPTALCGFHSLTMREVVLWGLELSKFIMKGMINSILSKKEVLEAVGHTHLPENRSLWFEQPWPCRSSVTELEQLPVPLRAPAGPSVDMKVLS